jgi:secondary thiamine-phosphate synthase enzyme
MRREFEVSTPSHACLVNITAQVSRLVTLSKIESGLCCVFVPHTTAAVTINENADPTVQSDIIREMDKVVPWNDQYDHVEGNAAAHIKVSMFGPSQAIIVERGKLQLGTWQGIYLAEFDGPRTRKVWVKLIPGT